MTCRWEGCNGEGEKTIEDVGYGSEVRKREKDTLRSCCVAAEERNNPADDSDTPSSDHGCFLHLPRVRTLVRSSSGPGRSPQPCTRRCRTVGGGPPKPDWWARLEQEHGRYGCGA